METAIGWTRPSRPWPIPRGERAGLVSIGRDAQRRPRRLEARPLAQATEWLERYREFWEGRFQRLDALLDEMQPHKKAMSPKQPSKRTGDHP